MLGWSTSAGSSGFWKNEESIWWHLERICDHLDFFERGGADASLDEAQKIRRDADLLRKLFLGHAPVDFDTLNWALPQFWCSGLTGRDW